MSTGTDRLPYFDVTDETRYTFTLTRVKDLSKISDNFLTEQEVRELVGDSYYITDSRRITNRKLIQAEIDRITQSLHDGVVKSVIVDDEELLELLRNQGLVAFGIDGVNRRRNRLYFGKPRKRKRTKPRRGDATLIWNVFSRVCLEKYKTWLPHIPQRERVAGLFNLYKKAFGWRAVSKYLPKENLRWCRMIWNKPEDYSL